MSGFQPLASTDKFVLADSTRCVKNRRLGIMQNLRNTTPALGSGERIRSGYSNYTTVTAPTGKECLKVVGIQNPTQEDVHIWFASSGAYIYMNPYWIGSSKQTGNMLLSETLLPTFTSGHVSFPTSTTMQVTNWSSYSSVTTTDYYAGWVIKNDTQTQYAMITAFSVSANVATFTFLEDVTSSTSSLLINGSFENYGASAFANRTDYFTNWVNVGYALFKVRSASPSAQTGTYYIHMYGNNPSGNTDGAEIRQTINVNSSFTVSWYECYDPSDIAGSEAVYVSLYDPDNYVYYNFTTDTWTTDSTQNKHSSSLNASWTQVTESVTLGTNQKRVTIRIKVASNKVCNIDNVKITQSNGFSWVNTDTYKYYRSTHDNLGFAPNYNSTLADAMTVNSQNSIIRLSGGQSSSSANKGVVIIPRLSRTYYLGRTLTYSGTYVSERRLKPCDYLGTWQSFTASENQLEAGTYYPAIACVYDGYQIGELQKYDSNGIYFSSKTSTILFNVKIPISTMNKRITGIVLYVAKDVGDTRLTGRVLPYRFFKYAPITDSTFTEWSFEGSTVQQASYGVTVDSSGVNTLANAYQNDSGMPDNVTDTSYAYSTEAIISGLRFLSNVYVTSEGIINRQELFTNPAGGNATVGNEGVFAIDNFPNVEGINRLRVEPTLGTKIQAIVPQGTDGMVVFKDKGIIYGRVSIIGNQPSISWEVIDKVVGMTTLNGYTIDEQEWIYFASFDSIYRYRRGQLEDLITDKDGIDWLYTYKNSISDTEKNNAVIWYLPKQKAVCFNFGLNRDPAVTGMNGMQWTYYIGHGWREVRYGESIDTAGVSNHGMKYITSLQDGSVLAYVNGTTAIIGKFDDDTFKDSSQNIVPYFNTGNIFGGDNNDIVLNRFVVNKTINSATTGTLDTKISVGGSVVRTDTGVDKTKTRLSVYSMAGEPKTGQSVGLEYNTNSSGEYIADPTTNKIWQIDSIELWGDVIARNTHVGD